MACRPLTSVHFGKFGAPAEVLRELQIQLKELMEIAAETDFGNEEESKQFSRNVIYIKGYYEVYEKLLRKSVEN